MSYRELDAHGMEFIFPTTTPVQFDPIAAHASLDRIMDFNPEHAFLTHYSRINHLAQHVESMHQLIDAYVSIARNTVSNTHDTDRFSTISTALESLLLQRIREHGCTLSGMEITDLISSDITLNTKGLEHWLDHTH